MKIATWNVNSLKVRLPHLLDWMDRASPDVVALQETKLTDDNFPREAIEQAGYCVAYSGQKAYNGVAVIARSALEDVQTDIPDLPDLGDHPDRRTLAVTIDGVRVINLYVVNGQSVGSDKYEHKLRWLSAVTAFVGGELARFERVVVLGDFNIAPDDRDVHDPGAWRDKILCSTLERQALQRLLEVGLSDTFRKFEQEAELFSWWDYRAGGFRRNLGLRIDLILASAAMQERCSSCIIDTSPRKLQRPSDHTPVVAEFD